eukprot:11832276-Alexandrium_andersonii.AAC.1
MRGTRCSASSCKLQRKLQLNVRGWADGRECTCAFRASCPASCAAGWVGRCPGVFGRPERST